MSTEPSKKKLTKKELHVIFGLTWKSRRDSISELKDAAQSIWNNYSESISPPNHISFNDDKLALSFTVLDSVSTTVGDIEEDLVPEYKGMKKEGMKKEYYYWDELQMNEGHALSESYNALKNATFKCEYQGEERHFQMKDVWNYMKV